ncbi:hypothetical protein PF011_g27320 [Phytophthora fragariae]|uniref:Secreted protein n=1 Tax=Phytophthora fragariae TaxID=53985 RepID=A0A6A3HH60_9STRA|nr:hypothetical protein PF011_g27320 [Phytophthora fragariae]
MVPASGLEQCCLSVVVLSVYSSTAVGNKTPHDVYLSSTTCPHQCCLFVVIHGVHISAAVNKTSHDVYTAAIRGPH